MLTDRPCFRPILGPSSHRGGFTRDMQRLAALVLALAVWFALPSPAHAQALPPPFAPQPLLRVFLDCNRCDFSYIRTEVTFIDYVRNREDGDVHVLVTTQRTGGGGEQWTLKYIGLGRRQGQDQTLLYNSPQTATDDEIRAGFVEIFKLGLVRYLTDLPVADRLRVTYKPVQGAKLKAKDRKSTRLNSSHLRQDRMPSSA